MLEINVGSNDRLLRIVAGAVLLGLVFLAPDAPMRWFGLVGAIPLLTGLMGRCPLYSIMGMTTCKVKKDGS